MKIVTGDKVKAVVDLTVGDRKISKGRIGEVVAVFVHRESPRNSGLVVRKFLAVKFGPKTQSTWRDNCFEKVEE